MKLEKRKPSGREKDEAAIELLNKLRERLFSDNVSTARLAAFNLSWMQEDGLEILKKALFGDDNITTKNAAAYGLRKMRGRMKKMALEILNEGMKHRDSSTKEVSRNALQLLGQKVPGASAPQKPAVKRTRIREISHESRPRLRADTRRGIGTRRSR